MLICPSDKIHSRNGSWRWSDRPETLNTTAFSETVQTMSDTPNHSTATRFEQSQLESTVCVDSIILFHTNRFAKCLQRPNETSQAIRQGLRGHRISPPEEYLWRRLLKHLLFKAINYLSKASAINENKLRLIETKVIVEEPFLYIMRPDRQSLKLSLFPTSL